MTKQDMPDQWYEDYERGRPGWPAEVLEIPPLTPEASVLDLGAGTGKLTRSLISRFGRVVAVEPDEAMHRLLRIHCPEADIVNGTADEIPLSDTSVDAVFVAQAFHWFNNKIALGQIARVLRPRGALVLMWNVPAGPTEPSIVAGEELLDARGLKVGKEARDMDPWRLRLLSDDWHHTFERSPFEELHEVRLPDLQAVDREGLVAFFASMGWIANLPRAERSDLVDEMRSLLPSAEYRVPWETIVYWTRLTRSAA